MTCRSRTALGVGRGHPRHLRQPCHRLPRGGDLELDLDVIGLGFGLILVAWRGVAWRGVAGRGGVFHLLRRLPDREGLSIDNVFVFALVFSFFAVPDVYQHKVLFWGVLGALAARLVFIFVGAELLQVFFWTAYVFGAFLIWTGWKMAVSKGEEVHPRPPHRSSRSVNTWSSSFAPLSR
jgi:hypothetical protein